MWDARTVADILDQLRRLHSPLRVCLGYGDVRELPEGWVVHTRAFDCTVTVVLSRDPCRAAVLAF